jgi:hypothetical protein
VEEAGIPLIDVVPTDVAGGTTILFVVVVIIVDVGVGVETGVDIGSGNGTGKTICDCDVCVASPPRSPLKSILAADCRSNPLAL